MSTKATNAIYGLQSDKVGSNNLIYIIMRNVNSVDFNFDKVPARGLFYVLQSAPDIIDDILGGNPCSEMPRRFSWKTRGNVLQRIGGSISESDHIAFTEMTDEIINNL